SQVMLTEHRLIGRASIIQFSPNGHQFYVFCSAESQPQSFTSHQPNPTHLTIFKTDGHSVSMTTESLESMGSQVSHHAEFHGYYRIDRIGYDWVVDFGGRKCLWLPP